jgi:hyperosmotically inducible periplasmic protein
MHPRIIGTTLLLALVAATTVLAGDRRDLRVAEDIGRFLNTHPQLSIFDDVNAEVENGVVTLTGKVTAEYKRNEVARLVSRVEGVREVRNGVSVLPSSPFDDELRFRAARAIYGHSAFWSYASMARPPIHIIVEKGRVTLAGVVASDVERTLARSLATGIGELSVTSELRTEMSRHP